MLTISPEEHKELVKVLIRLGMLPENFSYGTLTLGFEKTQLDLHKWENKNKVKVQRN
jgi:hypothetical protein